MAYRRSLAGLAGTAVAVLTVAALSPSADAAPAAQTMAQVQQAAIGQAEAVSAAVGLDSGGVWLDHGKAVVNVTNAADAQHVTAAGLTPKLVKYSFATLTNAKNSLDRLKNVPQTAWGIDTRTNQVVVSVYDSAGKATSAKVIAAATKLGDQARVEHKAGKLELYIAGGDAIRNSTNRCSLGFNVTRGGAPYLLTAGHCTNLGGTWSGGDVTGARIVESDCPGADSGLLTRPNGTGPGRINTGQVITRAGTPYVGEQMEKQGSTTGGGYGEVTSVDESVNFDVGVLNHEFGTTAYTDHGDSGGPAYDGSTGLGTLSGGDSITSYFYPLTRELSNYGLSLA